MTRNDPRLLKVIADFYVERFSDNMRGKIMDRLKTLNYVCDGDSLNFSLTADIGANALRLFAQQAKVKLPRP